MKKRLLAITLLLIYAVATLTACGGGEAASLLAFIDENDNNVDYGGHKVNIFFDNAQYDETEDIFVYDKLTLQGEALLNRVAEIEEKLNVDLVFIPKYDYKGYQTAALSNSISADIITYGYMNAMQMLAESGFLLPITDFPDYIDLSDTDKYGIAPVLESAMINSVPYAVRPCYWPGHQPMESEILVFNKDKLLANGLTNFHEFWENETWTWDTFTKEYLDKAYIETADGYLYALSTTEIQYFSMLVYSNNVQYVTKNSAGENVINPYPDSFIRAYEQGLEWYTKHQETIFFESGVHNDENLMNETAIVGLVDASSVTTGGMAYDAKFDYGLMPFPAGPDAPYGVWAQYVQRSGGMGIAKISEEPAIAAHTLSLLYDPFEEFGGAAGLYDYYNNNVFLTETDTEIYFALMEHVRYDYTFWNQSDVGRQVHHDFGTAIKQGKSVSESMEKFRNIVNEMVYDFIEPNYDYMYTNYYYQFDN